MKKTLALILIGALTLSLAACGGSNGKENNNTSSTGNTTSSGGVEDSTPSMTKEEMLEVAVNGDISELNSLIADNILSAKQAYCGKVLTMKHAVDEIKEDCIIFNHGMGSVIVYLPEEDIINLKAKQYITIVGITSEDFITTKESRYGPMAEDYTDCIMEQAYLVADRYEYSGTPKSKNSDFDGAWNVEFSNVSNPQYLRLVYFDDSVDAGQYEGKEITFSAKVIDGKYYDVVITG